MHLNAEQVERLRDGEPVAEAATHHVERCGVCASRIGLARAEVEDLAAWLAALDPLPAATSARFTADALRATLAEVTRATPAPASPRPARRRWRVAFAAAAFVVAAGVAFALPGSPFRSWLAGLTQPARETPAAPPAPVAPPAQPTRSGVAVVPGSSLVVDFRATQATGTLTVRLAGETDLFVEGPAGAAMFGSARGSLVVDNTNAAASFDVRVPRDAPRVEIRVAGRTVFLKEGDLVTADSSATADGVYVLPLAP